MIEPARRYVRSVRFDTRMLRTIVIVAAIALAIGARLVLG